MYNNGKNYSDFSPPMAMPAPMRCAPDIGVSPYLAELLTEYQKLEPFMPVLPVCCRLLRQEIMRISTTEHGDFDMIQCRSPSPSPMPSPKIRANLGPGIIGPWKELNPQEKLGFIPMATIDWPITPPNSNDYIVKKIIRMEVPSENYPNYNFVGRILGPRGNSLKRVEAHTGCRVFIRGKGSIKDSEKEEKLRGKPGFEHLCEPLHILIEAELPANVVDDKLKETQEILEELLKPVEESQDSYKRQQLRELALINSALKEDSPNPGSVSPFHRNDVKQAKNGNS